MFLETGDTCSTLFNMVIYETKDKEKEKKDNILFLEKPISAVTPIRTGETLAPLSSFLKK